MEKKIQWWTRSIKLTESKDCQNVRWMNGHLYFLWRRADRYTWTGRGGGSGFEVSSRDDGYWVPVWHILCELGKVLNG